ncbi:MAG: transglutaminase [Leptospiraceae bacterium]|nr:MAG: transglutaminase [Leptospiraceae bacterium]
MGLLNEIDAEILNLFYLYYEHQDVEIRKDIFKKITEKIPFGMNPYYFIELIDDSLIRLQLRSQIGSELNIAKIIYDFKLYMEEPNNLMKGSYLVSRLSDSIFINYEDYKKKYFLLVEEFLKTYPDFIEIDIEEQYSKIIDFLYCYKGFQGNFDDYHNPENSFITKVFETKKGIPVSLSVLTLLFYEVLKKIVESKYNKKLNFKIQPVNLPGHFLLLFSSSKLTTYFDPFHFGNKITYSDCYKHLLKLGYHQNPESYHNPPIPKIIARMLHNLYNIYSRRNETKKEKTIESLLKILNNLVQVEDKNNSI